MSQFLQIHPVTPQPRLIQQAVEAIRSGGVIVYPTDTTYALGCRIGDKHPIERIRRIRQLGERHNFTLACRDLSDIATYAKVSNQNYRLLKSLTPGPYTFILPATREVPRMLQHPKRKTIGIRVPEHVVTKALLEELGEPLMSTTMQMPGDELPMNDPDDIQERIGKLVDLIIDGGVGGLEPSSVLDLAGEGVEVVRRGAGDTSAFEGG
jgi:tRNA threonylcarbamoyl adenosine modification protein (Sua5/YciO/YrdC/YwlC family)